MKLSQYELRDITGSGANDLVIISSSQGKGCSSSCSPPRAGGSFPQQLALNPQFTSCEACIPALARMGYYLILDGQTGSSVSLASAILYYDARLQQLEVCGHHRDRPVQRYPAVFPPCCAAGTSTATARWRFPARSTRGLGALTVNRLSFIAWMDYTSEYEQEKSFGVGRPGVRLLSGTARGPERGCDGDRRRLPDSWQVRSADGGMCI